MADIEKPKELIGITEGQTIFGQSTPRQDVIDGWNIKTNDATPPEIDGLIPFVQLIGLYKEDEIERLVATEIDWHTAGPDAREVVFVGEDEQELNLEQASIERYGSPLDPQERNITEDQKRHFVNNIKNKFININLKDAQHQDPEVMTPGIILATNVSQAGNEAYEYYTGSRMPKDSGGVGITDMEIATGTKDFMNRRYKLRITVTDPHALNENPEYLKLTSLQSMFLIIHGWANPEEIAGWKGESPPRIVEIGTAAHPNGRMTVDLAQANTGGAWGAAVVATTMFDFAFNEVGQLEASFTFMPREISFLATYRVPVIAHNLQRLLGTGEKQQPSDPDNPEETPNIFAGLATGFLSVGGEFGKNLADVISEEQQAYVNTNTQLKGLWDNLAADSDFSLTRSLAEWSEQATEWSGNTTSLIERQKDQESRFRFPYAGPGIRTYQRQARTVRDPNAQINVFDGEDQSADEEAESNRVNIVEHSTKIVYYYLGWILEGLRFSMWDMNKNKVRRGETPFNIRFRYMPVPPDSTFNLAFQDELRHGLVPNVTSYIAEAVKYVVANCFPSLQIKNPIKDDLNVTESPLIRALNLYDLQQLPTINHYTYMGKKNEVIPVDWEEKTSDEKVDFLNERVGTGIPPNEDDYAGPDGNITDVERGRFMADKQAYDDMATSGNIHITSHQGWRHTLVEDVDGLLRIMHPRFDSQLLYSWVGHLDSGRARGRVLGATYHAAGGAGYASPRSIDGPGDDEGRPMGAPNDKQTLVPDQLYGMYSVAEFIGHISMSEDYGLIMPAVIARYYSPHYLGLQRRWYNKHVEYMAGEFNSIIESRIRDGISEGKTIQDIASEPVDLFRLTGPVYITQTAHTGQQQLGVTPWERAPQLQDYGRNYFTGEWYIPLTLIRDQYAPQLNDINRRLGELIAERDRVRTAQAGGEAIVEFSRSMLDNADSSSTTSLQQLTTAEDSVAANERTIGGLQAEVDFWQSRIDRVLIDLYNNDLINIDSDKITSTGILTIAGEKAPPVATDSEGNLIYQGDAHGRSRISDTTTRYFYNLATVDYMFYNLDTMNDLTYRYNSAVENDYADQVEWSMWLEQGFARYAATKFDNEPIELNLDNIDKIADLWWGNTLQSAGWESNSAKWLFMEQYENQYSDRYLTPEAMWLGLESGRLNMQLVTLKTARDRLINYILRQRELLRRYLQKRGDAVENMIERDSTLDGIDRIIADLEREQEDLSKAVDMATPDAENPPPAYSPFHGSTPLDFPFKLNKGGGRIVELNSQVAQQWEIRFRKREVMGVNDIQNYGPPEGGVAFFDKNESYWGWGTLGGQSRGQQSRREAEVRRVIETKGKANFGDWVDADGKPGPKSILNIDALSTNLTYQYPRGDMSYGAAEYTHQVRGIPTQDVDNYGLPNALIDRWRIDNLGSIGLGRIDASDIASEYSDAAHGGAYLSTIKVIWLVKAGFVDVDLIKRHLSFNYGFDNVGFEDNYLLDSDSDSEGRGSFAKLITGFWPAHIYLPESLFNNPGFDTAIADGQQPLLSQYQCEPYHLVDQDLDFVERAYMQASSPTTFKGGGPAEERYLHGLHPMDWVKVSNEVGLFGAVSDRNNTLYPASRGFRMAYGDHLPSMNIDAVRQLCNNPVGRPGIKPETGKGGATSRDDWLKETGGTEAVAGNAEWTEVAREISAASSLFYAEGRPAYNDEWPNGIPSAVQVDETAPDYHATPTYTAGVHGPLMQSAGGTFESSRENQGPQLPNIGGPMWYNQGVKDIIRIGSSAQMDGSTDTDEKGGVGLGNQKAPFIFTLLESLPEEFEKGFFSSVKNANEKFGGGPPLNPSLAEFMYKHLFCMCPQGRRIMVRANCINPDNEPPEETLPLGLSANGLKVRDVTYGDVFTSLVQKINNTADFSNQTIQNVAEIPIKREVVDNLLSQRNRNMSLLQFCQQVMTPSAIGLPGNPQIGVRNNNGVIELFPASISYRGAEYDIFKQAAIAQNNNAPPTDHLSFDYKRKNSLIQSIDMSSKMDPAAFLTYQNSSDLLRGRDYNVLKLLSYQGVAEDFKEFLDGTPNADNSGETYSGIITVGADRKIKVNKVKFEALPTGVLDLFIAQDPERWSQITAINQEQNNFTTELLAFYMRSVTLIIHGMTNLQPFNLINVSGVLPALEGIYIITNLTEKITPTEFQTIIEGKLLKRKRLVAGGPDVFI